MIVNQVHIENITIRKPENNPPISANRHAPKAFVIAFQRMQPERVHIHIVDMFRNIEAGQNHFNPVSQIRPDSSSFVSLVETL